jgi:signal transduction histidine kinase
MHRSFWRSTGVLAFATFGCAALVGYLIYDAACTQEAIAERAKAAHAQVAALAIARRLELEGSARLTGEHATRVVATVDELLRNTLARLSKLPMTGAQTSMLDSGFSVQVIDQHGRVLASRGRSAAARGVDSDTCSDRGERCASTTSRIDLARPFSGLAVVVSLDATAEATLGVRTWGWNRAQLAIALVSISAAILFAMMLHLRRERAMARVRSDFVSGVSHELRTPLAQIRMFAEVLKLGWVRSDDERQRAVTVIDQEARRLSRLVENVLAFSRGERDATHVAAESIELLPFVREVAETFSPLALERGMQLSCNAVPEDLIVTADDGALRQALLNLLDNAVKYGPFDQVVRIGAEVVDDDMVHLWVEDQGPGIPPALRERVWLPFERLERDSNAGITGNGIGLSVVRQLAEAQGGRAFIGDAQGAGTRVVIALPLYATGVAPELVPL